MTFDEAIAAAQTIAANYHRLDVLAIGRFVPAAQVRTAPERWGVSVLVDGQDQTVLWEPQSMLPFANYENKKPKKNAAKKSEPIESSDTPLLF